MSKVPSRGFSRDEFTARLAAVQAQMASQGMGALLLTTESDVFYFTGFLSQFWQSPTPLVRCHSRRWLAHCRHSRNRGECDEERVHDRYSKLGVSPCYR